MTTSSLRPDYGSDSNGISYVENGCLTTPNHDEINTATVSQRNINMAFESGSDISARQVLYEEGGATRGMNLYVYKNRLYCGFWNDSDDGNGTQIGSTLTPTSRLFAHSAAVGMGCKYSSSCFENGASGGSNTNIFTGKIYELMMFESAPAASTVNDAYLNFKSRLNF